MAVLMKYLRIRNFERFQHYKDRRPPWIKLYRDLWSDPAFFELSLQDRYFLISFFVVASQNENKIPANEHWLQREMAVRCKIPIESLVASGWLEWEQDASAMLATSVHDDSISLVLPRERDRERNTEEEKKPPNPLSGAFEKIWKLFPNPVGKKAALKHFTASVKTPEEYDLILRALDRYRLISIARAQKFNRPVMWQNGSTWFNNWRDWLDMPTEENYEKPTRQSTNLETAKRLLARFNSQNSGGLQCDDGRADDGRLPGEAIAIPAKGSKSSN
jgi:hypothetical protein